jgi:hypothetical protein
MKISEFFVEKQGSIAWLAEQSEQMEQLGHHFSDWLHNDGSGFGLVLVAYPNSGELHLSLDGIVTYHVETPNPLTGELTVQEAVTRNTSSVDDFEYIYRRFRDLVLGVAPNNSFKPNPLRGSA